MRVPGKNPSTAIARHLVAKPTVDELLTSKRQVNRAGIDFLKVDVATALILAEAALRADDPGKKQRNQKSARKAYDTIVGTAQKLTLSDGDAKELKRGLRRLRVTLMQLGEMF